MDTGSEVTGTKRWRTWTPLRGASTDTSLKAKPSVIRVGGVEYEHKSKNSAEKYDGRECLVEVFADVVERQV